MAVGAPHLTFANLEVEMGEALAGCAQNRDLSPLVASIDVVEFEQ
jgi:hypothetical protein